MAAPQPHWTEEDHATWRELYQGTAHCRAHQAHPLFVEGLEKLAITPDKIPNVDEVNARLGDLTGFKGVFEQGFVEPKDFFVGLSQRQFPIGNFIRESKDLSYTPAPDVFHDLYGHMPFFIDPDYADYCARFGDLASKYGDDPEKLVQFDRLFWFSIEFPLITTDQGRRIFGGGILSSAGESNYALSDQPEVRPFDVNTIRHNAFKIDEYQKILYLLDSPAQLYGCLDEMQRLVA